MLEYVSPLDGTTKILSMKDFFLKYSKDEFDAYVSPKGRLFPFLVYYNLVEPYKTNLRNNRVIYKAIEEFLRKSKDDQSVYKQILNLNQFSEEEILSDMMIMLFGGYDTTSHLISSVLYQLHKHPNILEKLHENLKSHGVLSLDPNEESKLKDIFEDCDYLNYVIKEGLRFDPPSPHTLPYFVKEDITICGVPISKGSIMRSYILFPHFNKDLWINPTEFIPERFDPESKFYKQSNPKSFVPFSFGIRNCAGQTLAKIEAKVE